MLKKQLEQGKLAATGGGGVAMTGLVPGLVSTNISSTNFSNQGNTVGNPQAIQAMQAHYQQALQQQQTMYGQQQQLQTNSTSNSSVGSFQFMPQVTSNNVHLSNVTQMNKTDSHAVLMELFARDQDLVRQAAEGAKLKAAAANAAAISENNASTDVSISTSAQNQQSNQMSSQHPMKITASRIGSVPALNSWPHFSSVSSLNNLGTLTGVKSITNMSGADLASQGNLNKKGNLAQVKSFESMGRADSYAFLEVFFDDRSNGHKNWNNGQGGLKKERDEDNDVGLNLDGDDAPTSKTNDPPSPPFSSPAADVGAPHPAPLPTDGNDKVGPSNVSQTSVNNGMKRAFDDALAARGLMSVSRSSEKLTDLALPAKIRRTLSQEFIRQQKVAPPFPPFTCSGPLHTQNVQQCQPVTQGPGGEQYPGQNPGQQQPSRNNASSPSDNNAYISDPSVNNASVEVPATTKCALCGCINVDTQLRPCGHMFHGRCLKPSLQNAMGPPTCPIDNIPMQSAVLAVPTDETPSNQHKEQSLHQKQSWDNSFKAPIAEASTSSTSV